MGRPSTYRPEHKKLAIQLMSKGASKVEVAVAIGISRDTFYRWTEENKGFSDTIKDGEWLSQAWWEKQGRENIANKQFNTALWYINMKNRFKWADKPEEPKDNTLSETRDKLRDFFDCISDNGTSTLIS